jgi:hypothetical protein
VASEKVGHGVVGGVQVPESAEAIDETRRFAARETPNVFAPDDRDYREQLVMNRIDESQSEIVSRLSSQERKILTSARELLLNPQPARTFIGGGVPPQDAQVIAWSDDVSPVLPMRKLSSDE